MSRTKAWFFMVLISLLSQTLPAETIHSKWIGRDMDRWYDAGHGNPGGIPNNSSGTGYVVTISPESSTRIDFARDPMDPGPGAIVLRDGTLAATTITQSAGASLQGFGTITGNLTLAPSTHAEFTGPTRIIGDLVITKGATLEISNGTLYVSGAIQNHGTVHLKNGQIIPQANVTGEGDICNLGTP